MRRNILLLLVLAGACEFDDCTGLEDLFDVTGTVRINDQPAPGVTVWGGGESVQTTADGTFRLTFERDNTFPAVDVVPPPGVHFRATRLLLATSDDVSLEFEGYREAAVSGRALAFGQPVSGVRIELQTGSTSSTTTSAPDGTYRFDAVPPTLSAPHWINVLSGPSGFDVGQAGIGINFSILGSDIVVDIEGTFTAGAVISGTVLSSGAGLGGIIVMATGPYSVADTTTPAGGYRFPPLPPGTYDVSIAGFDATAHRFAATSHTVTLTADTVVDFAASPILPNQPPVAAIQQPAGGASFQQGSAIAFQGSGTDPEDGVLTGGSLTWASSIDGALGSGSALTLTTLSVGTHTVTLTATDSQGASGSATIDLTVTSAPAVPGSVSGAVTANGYGIGGATVTLSGTASASTSTGSGGVYSFANLTPGTYTVTITNPFPGVTFPSLSQTVTLGSGQNLIVNFVGTYGSEPTR